MKNLNIGIIGCGAVTEIIHIPVLKRTAGFNIKKISDINEKRTGDMKKKYNLNSEITCDYREILDDKNIDAVLLATPPQLHAKIIIEAFDNDKDVLCEKPLTLKQTEALTIIEKMEETKSILILGYHFRFIPQFKKLYNIAQKRLGRLIGLQSTFCANAYAWPTKSHFQTSLEQGGGVFAEMGTHHFDLVSWILGKPEKIWCNLDKMDKKSPVYDVARLFIEYEGGTTASINMGWRNFTINRINIFGTEGFAYADHEKARVLINLKDLIAQPPIIVKAKIIGSPYQEEWKYFYKSVLNRKNPLYSSQDILSPVIIIEKGYESFKHGGKLIEFGEFGV